MSTDGHGGAVGAVLRSALANEYRSARPWLGAAGLGLLSGYVFVALVVVPRVADLGPVVESTLPLVALAAATWAGGVMGGDVRDRTMEVLVGAGVRPAQLVAARAAEVAAVWGAAALVALGAPLGALVAVGAGPPAGLTVALAVAILVAVLWGTACGTAAGAATGHPWVGSAAGAGVALLTWLIGAAGDLTSAFDPLEGIGPRRVLERAVLGLLDAEGLVSAGLQAGVLAGVAVVALELRRGPLRLRRPDRRRLVVAAVALATAAALAGAAQGRWADLSPDRSFTLDGATRELLARTDGTVSLVGLYRRGQPGRDDAARLLAAYAQASDRVSTTLRSPESAGALATDLGLADGGAVVVVRGERRLAVPNPDADRLAAAVRRAVAGDREQLCFTTRAGERDLDDGSSNKGFGRLDAVLAGEGYAVVPVLSARRELDDCDAVVVAAPTRPLDADLVEAIGRYTAAGGRLVVLTEPGSSAPVDALLAPFGARPAGDFVADAGQRLAEDPTVVVARAVGAGGRPGAQVVLQGATAVAMAGDAVPLLITSPSAWLESGTGDVDPVFDAATDVRGPFALAAAAPHPSGTGYRLVVVGDADVLANGWLLSEQNAAWSRAMLAVALRGEELPVDGDAATEAPEAVIDVSDSARWALGAAATVPPAAACVGLAIAFRRRRSSRWALTAITAAVLAAAAVVVGASAAAATTDGDLVVWGGMVVPVPEGSRVAANTGVQLVISRGGDRVEAAVAVQTLPLDLERLATLNGGQVTDRGTTTIGGASSRWIASTNATGFRFEDHAVADEGVALLTRWRPGSEGVVRELLRGVSFRGRFALRTPLTAVFELLVRPDRELPGIGS